MVSHEYWDENKSHPFIPKCQLDAAVSFPKEVSRDTQAEPQNSEHPHRDKELAPVRLYAPEVAHMQAEGQQADNANAREYVDVVGGLHVSPPFFHR